MNVSGICQSCSVWKRWWQKKEDFWDCTEESCPEPSEVLSPTVPVWSSWFGHKKRFLSLGFVINEKLLAFCKFHFFTWRMWMCEIELFHQHKLDNDNIKILDRESRWFQRGVREALQIRSRSPSLNRDRGRHHLPPIYNTLVKSRTITAASHDHLQSWRKMADAVWKLLTFKLYFCE